MIDILSRFYSRPHRPPPTPLDGLERRGPQRVIDVREGVEWAYNMFKGVLSS